MDELVNPRRLRLDALYLAVLTARGLKPLSRVEYEVADDIRQVWRKLDLHIASCTQFAANGMPVHHWLLASDSHIAKAYRGLFDGSSLDHHTPDLGRAEARYYGYPVCCIEAYIANPHMPSGLSPGEQALLFHRACVGCVASPRLVPAYRAALAEAQYLLDALESAQGASQASRCSRTKASSRRWG